MIGRRTGREVRVFSLSMLDVMSSALGAVLILFVIAQGRAQDDRADLRRRDMQLQRLNAALAEHDERMRAQTAALDAARGQAAQATEAMESARRACPPAGLSIGMCRVTDSHVQIHVFDHQKLDGDRVDLLFNDDPLASNALLTGEDGGLRHHVKLRYGANYVVAGATNEGDDGPNTATVVVSPCLDGRAERFEWDMKAGERRHISIVRPRLSR